ncbi:hypothetical protein K501DRAFT_271411 [Backusella circina FSU 941]|nr:hypothetical protein K501DRAFT_271411 [Backusella circina FSU 941]
MLIPCLPSNMNESIINMEYISTILSSSIFICILFITNSTNSILTMARVLQGTLSRVLCVGSCLGQILGALLMFYGGGKDTPPVVCLFFSGFMLIRLRYIHKQSRPSILFIHDPKERIPLFNKSNRPPPSQLNDTMSLLKDVRMIFCISNRVTLICIGMLLMSVTLLFSSLKTHSLRYLLVLLSFLGLSNGLIQTNLISKIGFIAHDMGFNDHDQAYTLYALFHISGSFFAFIISKIMNLTFQNERHSLVLLFSAMMLLSIPIMMNERMLR